jgi:hypothetical protein
MFFISSVSPNPAGVSASLNYHSPGLQATLLRIFDITGRTVLIRNLGPSEFGDHTESIFTDPGNASCKRPGVFFAVLHGDGSNSNAVPFVFLGN